MKFTLKFDGRGPSPAFIQDGEEKGRVLELEVGASEDGLEVLSMTVAETLIPNRAPTSPFHLNYEMITGKKPPTVPDHPLIKVIR